VRDRKESEQVPKMIAITYWPPDGTAKAPSDACATVGTPTVPGDDQKHRVGGAQMGSDRENGPGFGG